MFWDVASCRLVDNDRRCREVNCPDDGTSTWLHSATTQKTSHLLTHRLKNLQILIGKVNTSLIRNQLVEFFATRNGHEIGGSQVGGCGLDSSGQGRSSGRSLVNTVMNVGVLQKGRYVDYLSVLKILTNFAPFVEVICNCRYREILTQVAVPSDSTQCQQQCCYLTLQRQIYIDNK